MEAIERAFRKIGSRVKFGTPEVTVERFYDSSSGTWKQRVSDNEMEVNIGRDKRGEYFKVDLKKNVYLQAMNIAKGSAHLLLFARDSKKRKYRYLCGLDERGWFAAAVGELVSTVYDAMDSLKPESVISRQKGMNFRQRQTRRNRVFKRQGEWFFILEPGLKPDSMCVIFNEPIRRAGGSPHMVSEVYRTGGRDVYTCRRHPEGLNEEEFRSLLEEQPNARFWGWNRMRVEMDVYGRGRVTHRDHKPLNLDGWHRILPNRENEAWFIETLVFLD